MSEPDQGRADADSAGKDREQTRSGSFRLHVVLLLLGAALVLWGSSLAWITWTQPDSIALTRVRGEVSGADLRPAMRAFGLLALAGVPALFAVRRLALRRWFGAALGVVSGLAVAAGALDALAYRRHPAPRELVTNGGCLDGQTGVCLADQQVPLAGPALVLLGALLLVAAGLLAARRGRQWPGLGASYEAPGAVREEPVTDKGVWDALDRGDDPTA